MAIHSITNFTTYFPAIFPNITSIFQTLLALRAMSFMCQICIYVPVICVLPRYSCRSIICKPSQLVYNFTKKYSYMFLSYLATVKKEKNHRKAIKTQA